MELLKGSEHPIYEIELAVVLVAIEMGCSFERHLRGCNKEAQAALAALVSGRSAAANGRRVLQRILDVEKRTLWRLGVGDYQVTATRRTVPVEGSVRLFVFGRSFARRGRCGKDKFSVQRPWGVIGRWLDDLGILNLTMCCLTALIRAYSQQTRCVCMGQLYMKRTDL